MDKLQVVVEKNKCIGCSLCVKTCPTHNLKIQEDKAQVILEDCLFCGQCEAVCPRKAVTVSGYDHAPEEKNKGGKTGSRAGFKYDPVSPDCSPVSK